MNDVKTLHRQAMERTDLALNARQEGNLTSALTYFKEAFTLESQAAELLVDNLESEPTRSVLLRSAASLALDCNLPLEAEKLICRALIGNPPADIAEELRDVLEQAYFLRHLDLRGISLHENEIQMSIAGNAVGFGIASTEAFLDRVENTENLLYRTAERKQDKPYRDRGRREKKLSESLELYMTVPRAASFAVTFKVGKGDQLNLPGMPLGEQVIDELFECLDLFTRGDETQLKARINEEAYYRNFVGLARGILPDGKDVNVVGFTTIRHGDVKKVALTTTREESTKAIVQSSAVHPVVPAKPEGELIEVVGQLKFADGRKRNHDEIQLIESAEVSHTIIVPTGMMSDIVKPLWDTQVVVVGTRQGKKINLQDIRASDREDTGEAL